MRRRHNNPIVFTPVVLAALTGAGAAAGSVLATRIINKELEPQQVGIGTGIGAGVASATATRNPTFTAKFRRPITQAHPAGGIVPVTLNGDQAAKILTLDGFNKWMQGYELTEDDVDPSIRWYADMLAAEEEEARFRPRNPKEKLSVPMLGVMGLLGLMLLAKRQRL